LPIGHKALKDVSAVFFAQRIAQLFK